MRIYDEGDRLIDEEGRSHYISEVWVANEYDGDEGGVAEDECTMLVLGNDYALVHPDDVRSWRHEKQAQAHR